MTSAQGPGMEATRSDALWSGKNGARSSASSPSQALLSPAAVTGLMFLQVPPYPEVFRDSLHTYKLNEQDTDVRAALCSLCPLQPFPLLSLSLSSSSGLPCPSLSFSQLFIHLIHVLAHHKDNSLSLIIPLLFSFIPLTSHGCVSPLSF